MASMWKLAPRFDLIASVQLHVRTALDLVAARPPDRHEIVCLHDGYATAVLDVLAQHPTRSRLRLVVVDPDDAHALRRQAADRQVDLTVTGPDEELAPAAIVVAAGALAPGYDDVATAVDDVRARCRPSGDVIWTLPMLWPDHTRALRAAFASGGFAESRVDAVDVHGAGATWLVGSATRTDDREDRA